MTDRLTDRSSIVDVLDVVARTQSYHKLVPLLVGWRARFSSPHVLNFKWFALPPTLGVLGGAIVIP